MKLKHVVGSQRDRENYPVENSSDYRRISLYLVFMDHLVEEISKRVVSNEWRFQDILSKPCKSTTKIVDRLFNVYQTDIPWKVDFVDEAEGWKVNWALVNDKPEKLLDNLYATNCDLYPPGSS